MYFSIAAINLEQKINQICVCVLLVQRPDPPLLPGSDALPRLCTRTHARVQMVLGRESGYVLLRMLPCCLRGWMDDWVDGFFSCQQHVRARRSHTRAHTSLHICSTLGRVQRIFIENMQVCNRSQGVWRREEASVAPVSAPPSPEAESA
jgi:hypothetical protein